MTAVAKEPSTEEMVRSARRPSLLWAAFRAILVSALLLMSAGAAFAQAVIIIGPPTLPDGYVGVPYFAALTEDYQGATIFSSVGTLPPGVTMDSLGVISGTPTTAGVFSFTAEVTAAEGDGSRAYTITIHGPPQVEDYALAIPFNSAGVSTDLAAHVTGLVDTITFDGAAFDGTVTRAGDTLTFVPTTGSSGSYAVTYTATNPAGSSTGTITVTVAAPPAQPPVAADLSRDIAFNSPGTTIDLDPSITGTATLVTIGTGPAHGTVSVSGLVATYTPTTGYSGPDSFTYTATGPGGTSNVATVTLDIAGTTPPPHPEPDPELEDFLNAQIAAEERLVKLQMFNIGNHLDQLNSGGPLGNTQGIVVADTSGNAISYAPQAKASEPGDAVAAALGVVAADLPPADWGIWSAGRIVVGGNPSQTPILDFVTGGATVGIDRRLTDMLTLGAAIGAGRDVATLGTNGTTIDLSGFYAAVYGSLRPADNAFIDFAAGGSALDVRTHRFVTATGLFAEGERGGSQFFATLGAGVDFEHDAWTISPYGRIETALTHFDAFTETGGGVNGAMAFAAQDAWFVDAIAGLKLDYEYVLEWGTFTPGVKLELRQGLSGATAGSAAFAALPAGPFFDFVPFAGNTTRALLGVDGEIALNGGTTIGLGYDLTLGTDGLYAHALSAVIGARF